MQDDENSIDEIDNGADDEATSSQYQIPSKLTNYSFKQSSEQCTADILSSNDSAAARIPEEHTGAAMREVKPQALVRHILMTSNLRHQ